LRPELIIQKIASLYYAFAVDVITDLLIMFLPIGLIWNLQRPLVQKVGMGILFGIGWVCIAMAIVRVVQIGSKANSSSTPSSTWLAFWAVIESAIAVIVGCGPGLYSTAKEVRTTRKATYGGSSGQARYAYGSDGYRRHRSGSTKEADTELVGLDSVLNSPRGHRKMKPSVDVMDYSKRDAASSQEELTLEAGKIAVRHTVEVNSVAVNTRESKRSSRYGHDW
jgi:hypothetical protein